MRAGQLCTSAIHDPKLRHVLTKNPKPSNDL
jgi:hypothetical protein